MKAKNRSAVFALIFAAVALGGAGGAALWLDFESQKIDARTFCPKDGVFARTVVLLDATDPLSPGQQKAVGEYLLRQLPRELEDREWLGFFVLREDNVVLPEAEIALCYPGDADSANPLIENPRRRAKIFEEKFQRPMLAALARLVAARPPQSSSPILEMIEAAALRPDFDSTQKRRLVVVSDMLHNTAGYSHYQGERDFADFRGGDYGRRFLELPLAGVDVRILYLKREETAALQTRGHVRFWEDYFSALGARVSRLIPIR